MKKFLLVVGILSIAVLAFGAVGYAFAQSIIPPAQEYRHGPGMMEGYYGYDHGYGHGMMGGHGTMGWADEHGPMHDAMIAALAEALGLTPEEVEARHDAGESLWEIAESAGLSAEEIQDLMLPAHDLALENAIVNGWLTADQAEWMNDHMEQMWSSDYQHNDFGGHCGGGW